MSVRKRGDDMMKTDEDGHGGGLEREGLALAFLVDVCVLCSL